jgi:hypothetical protein
LWFGPLTSLISSILYPLILHQQSACWSSNKLSNMPHARGISTSPNTLKQV